MILHTGKTTSVHNALVLDAQDQRSKMHRIKRLLGLFPFFISHLRFALWWGLLRDALFPWCWRGWLEPDFIWPVWLAKGLPVASQLGLNTDLTVGSLICQAVISNGISQDPFARLVVANSLLASVSKSYSDKESSLMLLFMQTNS